MLRREERQARREVADAPRRASLPPALTMLCDSTRRAPAACAARRSGRAARPSPRPSPGSRATPTDRRCSASCASICQRAAAYANAAGNDGSSISSALDAELAQQPVERVAHLHGLGAQLGGLAAGEEQRRSSACDRPDGFMIMREQQRRFHARDRELEHVADPCSRARGVRARCPPRPPPRGPASSCRRRPAARGWRAAAGAQGSCAVVVMVAMVVIVLRDRAHALVMMIVDLAAVAHRRRAGGRRRTRPPPARTAPRSRLTCAPSPSSISLEHVVVGDAQATVAHLHRHVAVAEVIGGARQRRGRCAFDVQHASRAARRPR